MSRPDFDPLEMWRRVSVITLVQAAFLIIGHDPTGKEMHLRMPGFLPPGYQGAYLFLLSAVADGRLAANVVLKRPVNRSIKIVGHGIPKEQPNIKETDIDYDLTTVTPQALKAFLQSERLSNDFFPIDPEPAPGLIVEPSVTRATYPAKLAAAIACWEFLTENPDVIRGTSVKSAAVDWLTTNAVRLKLTLPDGSPNGKGIEEVAKVVNWQPQGGAPKTPS